MHFFAAAVFCNAVFGGTDVDAYTHITVVVLEILALGWPQSWICRGLRGIPRRHTSPYIALCRRLGGHMRRHMMDSTATVQHIKQIVKRTQTLAAHWEWAATQH